MIRARAWFPSWLCLAALLSIHPSCVRKSNPGGDTGTCMSSTECPTGSECQQGACVPTTGNTGGATSGGSTSDGGSSVTSGGTSTSGGSDGAGGSGGSTSGGSASGGEATGGGNDGSGGNASGGGGGGGGSSNPDMVDDFEDGDSRILSQSGRQGPWHIFNSMDGGNQTPSSNGELRPEMGGANGSMLALHTRGSGFMFAGFGLDLNNADSMPESMQSQAYDASDFTGISFMVKTGSTGGASLRLEIPTREFVPVSRGGTCPDSGTCWNVYGAAIQQSLNNNWQEIRVPFSAMVREQGGTTPALNVEQLMSISFKHQGSGAFDFWVDEIRFYK